MAKKKLLFFEDLVAVLSERKKSYHFSSKDDNSVITVQVNGNMKFDNSDGSKDGLLAVHLQANHTQQNVNGSNIDDEVAENALASFSNRPILGFIHNVNGQPEFYTHNMHQDDDGNVVYDEFPVGVIPESCDAKLVYDEEKGKTYVEVDGYIFEEYSKAAEIISREQELPVSVELSIRELSYNAKDKYLDIEDYFYSGVTILGKTPDGESVKPGMEGSNIKIADFSKSENKIFSSEKLDEMNEKLDELLSHFEINENSKEGGNTDMNHFDELLEKYNVSADDIDFDYSEMTDEELDAKFAELFEDGNENPSDEEAEPEEPETDESEDGDGSDENEESEENEEIEDDGNEGTEEFEKLVRTFEISHDDVRYALYNLLAPYEESDNEWYFISAVYDTHFVYESWNGTKLFGQNYTKEDDNVAFDGERYELFKELLTASEKANLDDMRANYSMLKEFKDNVEKNEAHAQRESIMNDEKFSMISAKNDKDEFVNSSYKELYENMDKYSCEELEEKLKAIVGEFAINGGQLEVPEKKVNSLHRFANVSKKNKKRVYGNLFN